MTLAIDTQALTKRFGLHVAVHHLNLTVEAGQIYGFLGRNGAGKTTTIRLLLGLLRPTSGSVRIFGHDVATDRLAAARMTGSLLEARATYDHLSGWENLDLTRRMLNLPARDIDRVLDIVDMDYAAHRKAGHYSLGMRQRLGLARALLGQPRLIIMDEPMNGLDPDGIRDMRAIIRSLPERNGTTVFLSSHLLSEVELTASHIGVMHEGRLVVEGAIGDLLKGMAADLFIRADGPVVETLQSAGYQAVPEKDGILVHLNTGDAEAAQINRLLHQAGCAVFELSVRRGTLESLYLQAQSREAA